MSGKYNFGKRHLKTPKFYYFKVVRIILSLQIEVAHFPRKRKKLQIINRHLKLTPLDSIYT